MERKDFNGEEFIIDSSFVEQVNENGKIKELKVLRL
jgi:hypothetical protein